jgi:hypothetical protein
VVLRIATPAHRGYQRERAISRLLEAGAYVKFGGTETGTWLEAFFGGRVDATWYASVEGVGLTEATTDDDLQPLDYLPELKELSLNCPKVTEQGLAHLRGLQSLESIRLSHVDARGLYILGSLPALTGVQMEHVSVDETALGEIARLPKLRIFCLRDGTAIEGALEQLAQAGSLFHLELDRTNLVGKELAPLRRLSQLALLSLSGTSITDGDLGTVARLKSLRVLVLDQTRISDAGLAQLEAMPFLTSVSIYGTQATKAQAHRLQSVLRTRNKDAEVKGP